MKTNYYFLPHHIFSIIPTECPHINCKLLFQENVIQNDWSRTALNLTLSTIEERYHSDQWLKVYIEGSQVENGNSEAEYIHFSSNNSFQQTEIKQMLMPKWKSSQCSSKFIYNTNVLKFHNFQKVLIMTDSKAHLCNINHIQGCR